MALTTSTITGRVPLPDDSAARAAELIFTLSGLDTEGVDVIPPGARVRRVLLIDGAIPEGFALWQNTAGIRGTTYLVEARWSEADRMGVVARQMSLGRIQIGDGVSYSLADLLNSTPPDVPSTGWIAVASAEEAEQVKEAATALAGYTEPGYLALVQQGAEDAGAAAATAEGASNLALESAERALGASGSAEYYAGGFFGALGGRGELLRRLAEVNAQVGTVVVIGDSITEQAKPGVGNGIGYVTYLSEQFPSITFINEGIGGNTTLDVIARMSSITAHGADGYIVAIGVNDARYNDSRGATSQSAYVANMTDIINALKAAPGYEWCAVLSIWPAFWRDQYSNLGRFGTDDRIRQWNSALESNAALNWSIPYINAHDSIVRAVDMSNVSNLIPDGIHPDYSTTAGKRLYAAGILREEIRKSEFVSSFVTTGNQFYKIRVLNNGATTCNIQNIRFDPYHKEFFAFSADPAVAITGLVGTYNASYGGYKNKLSDYPFEIIINGDLLPNFIATVPRGIGKGIKAWELYRSTDPDAAADPKHHSWQLIAYEYSTNGNAFNLFPRKREGVFYRIDFLNSDGTDGTGGITGKYVKVSKVWGGVPPVRYAYENMVDNGGASQRFDLYFSDTGGSSAAYMANAENSFPLRVSFESPQSLNEIEIGTVVETGRQVKDWVIYRSYDPACLSNPGHPSWLEVAAGTGAGTAVLTTP